MSPGIQDSSALVVDTGHGDMIHDAQMDFYGVRLATCSSDRSVRIFDVKQGHQVLQAELKGHEGPVWEVSWAHPKFGVILASCSYDKRVIIWREKNQQWDKLYEYTGHDSSVNSVSWGPHEYGLLLACGSSDGTISLLQCSDVESGVWQATKITSAHANGCNAVSWAPAIAPGALLQAQADQKGAVVKRFASGGCDNLVKVWREDGSGQWVEDQKLEGHSDWVRGVAWAPSHGAPKTQIASCSQDKRVIIWTNDGSSENWRSQELQKFDDVVWSASWSHTGGILAVTGGDNKTTLWRQSLDEKWASLTNNPERNAAGITQVG